MTRLVVIFLLIFAWVLRSSAAVPVIPGLGTARVTMNWKVFPENTLTQPRLTALFSTGGANARYLEASAEIMHRLGTQTTEKALRNWPKLANALCPLGESGLADDLFRFADLRQALKLETSQGQKVLVDLLEGMETKTADDIITKGCPMSASIKDLYPTMYHYSNERTMVLYADDMVDGVEGSWRLLEDARPDSLGRYVSPDDLSTQAAVIDRFQLPLDNVSGNWLLDPTKGRFKFVFETEQVVDDLVIPPAYVHSGAPSMGSRSWLETLVKDNQARGAGNGIQYVQKKAIKGRLLDQKTGQWVKDKVHLQQLVSDTP